MRARAKAKKRGTRQQTIDRQVEVFNRATEARYEIAMRAYKAQDKMTRDALDLMVARLRSLATGQIRIFPEGRAGTAVVVPIESVQSDQNIMFLATEILKDLAMYDIQVANYEFPPSFCVECGDKITPTKAAKKRVRRK